MAATYTEGDEPVPGYRLMHLLGWGRFGEVWKAGAPGGFETALKFICLASRHGLKEYQALRLFRQVRHPNLVPLMGLWLKDKQGSFIDEAVADGSGNLEGQAAELIVAMGLGERNLFDRLKECQEKLEFPGIAAWELLGYMEQMAAVLDFLHQPMHDFGKGPQAIQHCDIKPHNILLVGKAAQLCDLGVARVLEDPRSTAAMGSAAYISPECVSLGKPSNASDQYSLAITYVELRTGVLPIEARSIAVAYMAHMNGKLDLSRLPSAEQQVIRRATALDPAERFTDLRSMVRALQQALLEGEQRGDNIIPPLATTEPEQDSDEDIDLEPVIDPNLATNSRTMVLRDRPSIDNERRDSAASLVRRPARRAGALSIASLQPEAAVSSALEQPNADSEAQMLAPSLGGAACPEPEPQQAADHSPLPVARLPGRTLPKRQRAWVLAATAAAAGIALTGAMLFRSWGRTAADREQVKDCTADSHQPGDDGSASGSTSAPPSARARDSLVPYRRGLELLGGGEYRLALLAFDESLEIEPDRPEVLLARAQANFEMDRFDRAVEDCDRVVATSPKDARAWELRARAHYRSGQADEALQDADTALTLNSLLAEPYFISALVLAQKKQFFIALTNLNEAIRLRPGEARYHFARTELKRRWQPERLGDWIAELTRQAERGPAEAAILADRGHAWFVKGDLARAIADCTRALELDGSCAAAYAVRARATADAYRKGWRDVSLDRAIDDATAAICIDPNIGLAYYARALARAELGEFDQSKADFLSAERLSSFLGQQP